MSQLAVGIVRPDEWRSTADLLAEAFGNNPLNVAVIGGDRARRVASNRAGMRAQVPLVARHGLALVARDGGDAGPVVGALLAAGPGEFPFPLPSFGARLRLVLGQGIRVASRWAEVAEALAQEHWVAPHHYLSTLGVAPSLWGRGIGRALLTGLARAS